ncbi:hypothetical protein DL771_005301 [Monosporascus sp. 5C6A]|nr:hypothetical protein DL771_005301 [Monosporascus sp. 5C6A]
MSSEQSPIKTPTEDVQPAAENSNERTLQISEPSRGNLKAYEAPITNPDDNDKVEGEFCVILRKGYSLEAHDKVVGRDMKPYNREIILKERETHGLVYGIDEVDDDLLARIRADEGVEQCRILLFTTSFDGLSPQPLS